MINTVNFKRRKHQAQENVGSLITDVCGVFQSDESLIDRELEIHNLEELDQLIRDIEPDVLAIAQSLHPDWAIPIVIQAIGEIYYGQYSQYAFAGNYFKRSLTYLWQNSCTLHGEFKNLMRLQTLIKMSYMMETLYSSRKMFFANPELYLVFYNGHVNIPEKFREDFLRFGLLNVGKGKRFRIAEVNSKLMNEQSLLFMAGLIGILNGESPRKIPVFQNTFYEHVPGIENSECALFWKEVFFRFSAYISAIRQLDESEDACSVVLFNEYAATVNPKYFTQEIVENSFWKQDWFRCTDPEVRGNLVVERPILRISPQGAFATSAVLLGDSLNNFVEAQLMGYPTRTPYLKLPGTIFKNAFSEKFEDQCIELFREYGFQAGHVLESGVWKKQKKDAMLSVPSEKLYGEVDVLAYHTNLSVAFLVECKVLLDVRDSRSYQNLSAKLKDDSECFKDKLRKKGAWIQKALSSRYNQPITPYMMLVTDIPMPILGVEEEDIAVIQFQQLQEFLEENFKERTSQTDS